MLEPEVDEEVQVFTSRMIWKKGGVLDRRVADFETWFRLIH